MTGPSDGDERDELPDDADLGAPVSVLSGASFPLDDHFETQVRDRIERRLLGGDIIELWWTAPLTVLLEFLSWPMDLFRERNR